MRSLLALSCLLLLAACFGGSGPARQTSYGPWQIMTSGKQDRMLCYAAAPPEEASGMASRDAPAYLMATRRPSGKIEISASAGYPYKRHSRVTLLIDGKGHPLFFKERVAWARGDAADREIIAALKHAHEVRLRALSVLGGRSDDAYSAEGFAGAIARIRTLCP